jgi:leucyl-tRNA synthetase
MNREKYLVTTAFPYVNGDLHIGNGYCYSLFNGVSKLLKSLGKEVLCPFSFHTTGLPIVSSKPKHLLNSEIPEQIKKELLKDNYNPLLDFYSKRIISDLSKIGLETDPYFHQYTHDSREYQQFLDHLFKVFEKNIFKDKHPIIFCLSCNHPLGDHERSQGQTSFILEGQKQITEITALLLQNNKKNISFQKQEGSTEYFLLSEKTTCKKCKEEAVIKQVEDWFIDYHSIVSTELFSKNLSCFDENLKKLLINRYTNLRPWGLTRERGLGPSFVFDRTRKIESLSDSILFPFYYLIKNSMRARGKPFLFDLLFEKENLEYIENHIHVVGKDLVENHVLFMILWEIMLLGSRTTTFLVGGHILLEGKKLSKSKTSSLLIRDNFKLLEKIYWKCNEQKDIYLEDLPFKYSFRTRPALLSKINERFSLVEMVNKRNSLFSRIKFLRENSVISSNSDQLLQLNGGKIKGYTISKQLNLQEELKKIDFLKEKYRWKSKKEKISKMKIPYFYFKPSLFNYSKLKAQKYLRKEIGVRILFKKGLKIEFE